MSELTPLEPWRQTETKPDMRYPLYLVVVALLLLCGAIFFHRFFPDHVFVEAVTMLAIVATGRFVLDKVGIYRLEFVHRERSSSFRAAQALADGFAFGGFMLALFTFTELKLFSYQVVLALAAGLLYGIYGGWHPPTKRQAT